MNKAHQSQEPTLKDNDMKRSAKLSALWLAALCIALTGLCACTQGAQTSRESESSILTASDIAEERLAGSAEPSEASSSVTPPASEEEPAEDAADEPEMGTSSTDSLRTSLGILEDYWPSFVHGEKGAAFQKYIVLHDTESESAPEGVVDFWDGNGNLVAAHFVVGKDGSIVQCVPLDNIAHHAGFGDAGHNALYGVDDESRDDKLGMSPIGDWAPDYGMNSYSVGIEMVIASLKLV